MEKLHFSTSINAPREKVWDVLWNKATYPAWTSVFGEGSTAETDWKEGSEVRFFDSTHQEGMLSRIAVKKPNEYMSFQHLGMIKNGVADTESPEVKAWAGAEENYTLHSANGQTELAVDMDITAEHAEYFKNAWPKALEKVKELSEQ
ncbi:SRPBCC domain-containing protein [Chitinophaga lutea]|uniref:SRPBCC domain-containing protein n=1 Tax=Chitinophaga lutea TaxID=2488634 RepID=A0A3N4PIK2_9BACT|nr:SRPBCC domain-containing protein [Chitinophaga lutea]RPE08046.1 SRPBCC domain-containing protein [Chitinophaga lutea]